MSSSKSKSRKAPKATRTTRGALLGRISDLIGQHQKAQWPETKINFGGYYPELTREEFAADPDLPRRVKTKQKIEEQRRRWLNSLYLVLNDAHRYLLDVRYTEASLVFERHPLWLFKAQSPDEKVRLEYLEKPILKDLESMKALLASTGRRTRPGSASRKVESHLTMQSVLLIIAREARGQKQHSAAIDIDIPQPHLSRLETGSRPWTTKNTEQCAGYVCDSPHDGIVKAFFKLAAREFRSS